MNKGADKGKAIFKTFPDWLFWDVNRYAMNPEDDKIWIINRVLSRCMFPDTVEILDKLYKKDCIRVFCKAHRGLFSIDMILFLAKRYQLPVECFRSFTPEMWNDVNDNLKT